jgi:hypothetical protein
MKLITDPPIWIAVPICIASGLAFVAAVVILRTLTR